MQTTRRMERGKPYKLIKHQREAINLISYKYFLRERTFGQKLNDSNLLARWENTQLWKSSSFPRFFFLLDMPKVVKAQISLPKSKKQTQHKLISTFLRLKKNRTPQTADENK